MSVAGRSGIASGTYTRPVSEEPRNLIVVSHSHSLVCTVCD